MKSNFKSKVTFNFLALNDFLNQIENYPIPDLECLDYAPEFRDHPRTFFALLS